MARFLIDIQKRLASEWWTNTYIVEAADIDEARILGNKIVIAERAFHSGRVTFDKMRVSTLTRGDNVYITEPGSVTGQLPTDQPPLPLFCTVNVVFGTGANRPARKYYRVVARTNDINAEGEWSNNLVATVQGALENLINVEQVPLFDRGGDRVVTVVVQRPVGMRQLRRGSKRRQRPVI